MTLNLQKEARKLFHLLDKKLFSCQWKPPKRERKENVYEMVRKTHEISEEVGKTFRTKVGAMMLNTER